MKCRNGFVSNSSSSSFVILTSKADFDRVLDGMEDWIKDLVTELRTGKTDIAKDISMFGQCMVEYGYQNGNSNSFEWGEAENILNSVADRHGLEPYDLLNELGGFNAALQSKIPKDKIFFHAEDF